MNIKTSLQQSQKWLVTLLLLAGSITSYGQSNCFTYTDEGKTITGLTDVGRAAYSLTVPATVTTVKSKAFSYAAYATTLIIEAGGNPVFEEKLFDDRANPLYDIQILGSSMTVANISALFESLDAKGKLSTVYIAGYSGEWSNIAVADVLTEGVSVSLPAAMVTNQQFGDAKVCGRIEITKELITFCGNVTFQDIDDGSNMVFYVADYRETDGRLHIQRVKNIAKGEGVLIHNAAGTSTWADLPRLSTDKVTGDDTDLYDANMLVGVTNPTTIGRTDGNKTNYILSNGAFHPTSGGTIGANKAYLQILTSAARETLTISFDDESTGVKEVNGVKDVNDDSYFDLQGRKVTQPTKGLYIMNGKKYVIR